MFTRNQKIRRPRNGTSAQTGISVANGGVFPVTPVSHQEVAVQSVKVEVDAQFAITAAPLGAASSRGVKILSMPTGRKLILATLIQNIQGITPEGLSVASAVLSLGSTLAATGDGTLTAAEADYVASTALGDGTLAAAATEFASEITTLGKAGTPGLSVGAASARHDVFLNVGGTFTHATLTAVDLRVRCTVEVFFIDLGPVA